MRRSGRTTSFDPPMEAEWHRMISEAAYLRAEKRGFAPGYALDDWLLAEQDIKALICLGAIDTDTDTDSDTDIDADADAG